MCARQGLASRESSINRPQSNPRGNLPGWTNIPTFPTINDIAESVGAGFFRVFPQAPDSCRREAAVVRVQVWEGQYVRTCQLLHSCHLFWPGSFSNGNIRYKGFTTVNGRSTQRCSLFCHSESAQRRGTCLRPAPSTLVGGITTSLQNRLLRCDYNHDN